MALTRRYLPAVLCVLLAVTAALAPPVATAGAGETDDPVATEVVGDQEFTVGIFHDDRGPKLANDIVGFAGRLLETESGKKLAGRTLTLQRRLSGEEDWTDLDTAVTAGKDESVPKGWAVFSTAVVGTAAYRVVFAGDETHLPSQSQPMPLDAMRDLNSRKVTKGDRVYLAGTVSPDWVERRIDWQRKRCADCRWRTIDHRRTTSEGAWRFRAVFPPVGKVWRLRGVVRAADGFVRSPGAVLRVRTVQGRSAVPVAARRSGQATVQVSPPPSSPARAWLRSSTP